jgi:hypothetical protein
MKIKKSSLQTIILLGTIILVGILRFHLTIFRYFDTDEFAHLHWAYHFVLGMVPYRDFFIYHIPFFQWFLLPLYLLPQSPETLVIGRLVMLVLFIFSMTVIAVTFSKLFKNRIIGLLILLFALISPIMIDKGIEIRPDVLMVCFFICSMAIVLLTKQTPKTLFIAGLCMSLSILTFQKMIFALPAFAVLLMYKPLQQYITTKKRSSFPIKAWIGFIAGGLIPVIIFLLYLLLNGAMVPGIDAIFRNTLAIYSYQLTKFSPFLPLTPWIYVYVDYEGPNIPWAVNTLLLLSMIGGTFLFAVDKKWKLFWFYLLFFVGAVLYLILFPTPYVQYFIPVMMIGAPAAAYFFYTLIHITKQKMISIGIIGIICFVALLSFGEQYLIRIKPINDAAEQKQVIRDVVSHIKQDESVYDMAGSYVFRPPGYVLCCHRYEGFISSIRPQPISLKESLLNNQTKFIVLDRNGYAFWQVPEPDKTFVRTNYLESAYKKIYSVGYRYTCSNSICSRANYEGGTIPNESGSVLPIVIEETYKLHTLPLGLSLHIDGKEMKDQETRHFMKGTYQLSVPSEMQEFKIQLDR